MAEISEALTRKCAHLARLGLSDAEVKLFTPQIQAILDYVEKLKELDVSAVEPLRQPFAEESVLREDRVEEGVFTRDGTPKALACAPDLLQNGYKVPPIL